MADLEKRTLAFDDTAKFITNEIGAKGTVVLIIFEDGRVGITTDGLNHIEVQSVMATGIYLNMDAVIKKSEKMQ